MNLRLVLTSCVLLLAMTNAALNASDIAAELEAIRSVRKEGQGNAEAAEAWKQLIARDTDVLIPLLEGMDEANELARNWLSSAVQVIAEKAETLPAVPLGEFLMTTRHHPRARQLAFELIERAEPETAARLVPGFLHDPSTDLRRRAVAELLDEGKRLTDEDDAAASSLLYRQALGAARDVDQIQEAARALTALGQVVDLPKHFGFLQYWKVAGPFSNKDRSGFETAYPPEAGVDLTDTYKTANGEVGWTDYATSDVYGMVDLNEPLGALKEVTAYAFTTFQAESAGPAELRLGCKNAWKVWFNGEFLFGRDEYHRLMRIDQYVLPIQLRQGPNTILVKVCQNEQVEDWTVEWQFQLRVCDATGTAILATDRPPTPLEPERGRQPDRA